MELIPPGWTTQGVPDFLIIGAQKSGTSSIHNVLAHHPDVYLPEGEVFFFDVDDAEQHPDFFAAPPGSPRAHSFERDFDRFARWYRGLFAAARPGQHIGEDSTTYLASRVAPARIRLLLPDAKLIVVLRNPVARTYSHYWHSVSTGRATLPFARQLAERPGNLLERSYYREHLERYLAHFPASQIHVIVFERFVAQPQEVTDELCAYLGLSPSVDVEQVVQHRNAAQPPLHLGLRLWWNRVASAFARKSYRGRLPHLDPGGVGRAARAAADRPLARALVERWEALQPRRQYEKMPPDVRRALAAQLREANAGLDELLGINLADWWPDWRDGAPDGR